MSGPLERTLSDGGEGLETPWPSFNRYVRFRPGSIANVFSAPGVGKSMWALNLVYGIAAPSLYITIDTPLSTQATRAWAHLGGVPMSEVERDPHRYMLKAARMPGVPHVEWSDVPMLADELPDLVDAEVEYLGRSPAVVVVDVIGDLIKERSYEGFTHAFQVLKTVARKYKATCIALHHTRKDKEPNEPVYLRDAEYAGDKQPDVVIGMHMPGRRGRRLRVAILKNRLGKADPRGSVFVDLDVDMRRATVLDPRED